ncbi:carbohydrate ABC transporter permease [Eubacterium sp. am_0171]|uniref:Inner membrane ABC transporter permease protein ycjP n=1 Tax=Faecalicatena contorta TaxID=39482 RepID=A0A174H236_9FIRM|nr:MULTISPECIES: carbohydrate ABC transporter permease [Clostridia]MSC86532.1 ABC transporter permease subunit [Eubacterium sp. BIOML-A1]MSD08785.1 ABC transporter permease subunit [Eubacterium sp. BIOML-A2]RYT11196.1 carbohydrate ABC transporter permease [Eubacterium sp. am_0171]CUO67298.1 Inner membrane ABC transporter permease protein ycjP [[Eubacterium] contortum] [Faecalicatena contorta]
MKKSVKKEIIFSIIIVIFFAIMLSPLLIALSGSFRSPDNGTSFLQLFNEFSLESYKEAFEKMHYFRSLKNSVITTFSSVAILLVVAALAGYALARLKTRIGGFLQIFFLAGMMISAQMSIIPIYNIMRYFKINNSYIAPIVMYVTISIPFSIFVYTNFVKSGVPIALEEAARIDGAGRLGTFFKIVIPLTKPVLASIIITQGVPIWNDFFLSMLFLSSSTKKTLPLVMLSFLGDMQKPTQWTMLFAACFLSALPMLLAYAFLQKQFVGGLTVGAVKG